MNVYDILRQCRDALKNAIHCGFNEEPHGVGFTPSKQEKRADEARSLCENAIAAADAALSRAALDELAQIDQELFPEQFAPSDAVLAHPVAEPVAWITEEPDGNDFDASYGGVRRGVVLGSEPPDFGVTPLYPHPRSVTLPPLPEPMVWGYDVPEPPLKREHGLFTADQMREYAIASLRAAGVEVKS